MVATVMSLTSYQPFTVHGDHFSDKPGNDDKMGRCREAEGFPVCFSLGYLFRCLLVKGAHALKKRQGSVGKLTKS